MAVRRKTTLIVIAFVVFVAVVATFAFVGSRVSNLATSLAALASETSVLERHAKNADLPAVSGDLIELNRLAQAALVAASDPTVAAVSDGVPIAGRYLDAARTMAQAASGLTAAAQPLAKLLPDLAPDKLVSNGRYNVATLTSLDTVMKSLAAQLPISQKQLASIDRDGLDSRIVTVLNKLSTAISSADGVFTQAEPLLAVLPVLLGGTEKRTWFVALQNLAESRGTGGILSAYTILDIDSGKITLKEKGSDKDLIDKPFTSTEGLPSDFLSTWDVDMHDWRDINVSPNFPYTGQLIANGWKDRSGENVDGVLAFGQGVVQYMLAATGPITLAGNTLDASNVVPFLTLGIYQKYPNVKEKDAIVGALVAEIFTRLSEGKFNVESLIKASSTTQTSDRLQAWSSHADTQKQIVAAGIGSVVSDTVGPTTAVAINNGGGNKLEQFLKAGVSYSLGQCGLDSDGHSTYDRSASMTVTLTNTVPTSGLPPYVTSRLDLFPGEPKPPVGSNLEIVSVYAPVDAIDNGFTLDGQEADASFGDELNRPVYYFYVELKPGQTRTLVVNWTEPTVGDDTTDILGAKQSVAVQPMIHPITVATPAAAVCDTSK